MEEVNTTMESRENPIIKDDEIDLIEVTKTIWAGRKLILRVTAVFFIFGLIIAFGSDVEYEASCKLMPESQEGMKQNLGGLGSLAGLAGINLDIGGNGAITPELYPEIVQSLPFLLKILNEPIQFEKPDTTVSSFIYFKKINKPSFLSYIIKYSFGLPKVISNWNRESQTNPGVYGSEKYTRLTLQDNFIITGFKKRINVEVDSKTGIIKVSATMPDKVAAAEITDKCVVLLTEFVVSYKTEKSLENLDFIQDRFDESKSKYEAEQKNLALFNDRNMNVSTSFAQIELQKLQNNYNIAYEVFKGLSTQLEQAKIKVKEKTPIFTILNPVEIPIYKSKPQRKLIASIAISFGIFIGIGSVFFKNFIIPKFQ